MTTADGGVYRSASEIDFDVSELPRIPLPDAVLFVRPTHFQVAYVINPHMEGRVGSVVVENAQTQWSNLVAIYRDLSLDVRLMDGPSGLPDMVFCANQTLPFIDEAGNRTVVLSNMATEERRKEVTYFEEFFEDLGYTIHDPPEAPFEGMGDALRHFDRSLLWVGTGYRSSASAVPSVSQMLGVKTIELRLVDPHLYHLDTCLSILDAETALWVPTAFDGAGREMISALFSNLIAVPVKEAKSWLACNAHCPDGHHVVIQAGCTETTQLLEEQGFEVIECETGEFLKSGGSVFCMKQMFWGV